MDAPVSSFDPTRAPTGRLTRLGVVLDGRTPPGHATAIGRMCARAGIDVVWLGGGLDATPLAEATDPWLAARELADVLQTGTIGLLVEGSDRLAADVAGLPDRRVLGADTLTSWDGRFELLVVGDARGVTPARAIRDGLAASAVPVRLSGLARTADDLVSMFDAMDDIVLSAWHTPDLETAADEARAAAAEAGRDPASLGVAVLLPVSVGRTEAEASARAEMDPAFVRFGHPADIGIFGTLEECQDRVIALAHAGITDLRCVLPATPDVHDVIAQLTAITLGTTSVLVPGSLRSPSPPPPDGWGGRPDRPPSARLSSGSRRRG